MSLEIRVKVVLDSLNLDVDLMLPGTGVSAIFGPSGAGKTSLLRAIAGLDNHKNGRIVCNGQTFQDGPVFVPVHRRSIGYVFQQPGLFTHLNVRQNIDYAVNRASNPASDVKELVELLGVQSLVERRCNTLSGGEAQRVAIVRALASGPKLLLMDEPLSSLDQRLKDEFMPYLEKLHSQLSIPIIYVSHSRLEVARISDFLVLLDKGNVLNSGKTADLFTSLDSPLGTDKEAQSIIQASRVEYDEQAHLFRLNSQIGELWVSARSTLDTDNLRIRIFAKDVSVCLCKPEKTSVLNIIPATLSEMHDNGKGQVMLKLDINDHTLLSRITSKSVQELDLKQGMAIFAQVKSVAVIS